MALKVGELFVTISADTRDLERGAQRTRREFRELERSSDSLARALGTRLASAVAAVGFAKLASDAIRAAIEFNAMIQQAEIGFETMLGSAERAREFMRDIRDFAARTPFEVEPLMRSTQQMLAYGMAAERVLPMLRAIGDASAALGLGSEGIDRITRALGQMQAKGVAAAQEMQQLAEAGVPAWEILAEKIGVDVAEAMDLVSKRAVTADQAITALVAGMNERFGGMMERQAQTLAGLASRISEEFREAAAAGVQPLFEELQESMEWAIQNLPFFAQAIELAFGGVSSAVANAIELVRDLIEAIQDMILRMEPLAQRILSSEAIRRVAEYQEAAGSGFGIFPALIRSSEIIVTLAGSIRESRAPAEEAAEEVGQSIGEAIEEGIIATLLSAEERLARRLRETLEATITAEDVIREGLAGELAENALEAWDEFAQAHRALRTELRIMAFEGVGFEEIELERLERSRAILADLLRDLRELGLDEGQIMELFGARIAELTAVIREQKDAIEELEAATERARREAELWSRLEQTRMDIFSLTVNRAFPGSQAVAGTSLDLATQFALSGGSLSLEERIRLLEGAIFDLAVIFQSVNAVEVQQAIEVLNELRGELERRTEQERLVNAGLGVLRERLAEIDPVFARLVDTLEFEGLQFRGFDEVELRAAGVAYALELLINVFDTGAAEMESAVSRIRNLDPGTDVLSVAEAFRRYEQIEENRQKAIQEVERLQKLQQQSDIDALEGAFAGAAVGFAVGGPIGALVGGIIGAAVAYKESKQSLEPEIQQVEQEIQRLERAIEGAQVELIDALGIAADNFASGIQSALDTVDTDRFEANLDQAIDRVIRQGLIRTFIAEVIADDIQELASHVQQAMLGGGTPEEIAQRIDTDLLEEIKDRIEGSAEGLRSVFEMLQLTVEETTQSIRSLGRSFNLPSRFTPTVGLAPSEVQLAFPRAGGDTFYITVNTSGDREELKRVIRDLVQEIQGDRGARTAGVTIW